jgi:lipoprotein signal peptidase
MTRAAPYWTAGLTAALGLAADQGSKWALIHGLGLHEHDRIVLLPVFDLVMWWNRGVSFSLFDTGAAWGPYLFSLASLAIVALLVVWLSRTTSRIVAVAIGAVIGGALGNVIDRLRFGAVADFFYAHIGPYGWPAFNVADSLIVLGVAILVLDGLFGDREAGGVARREGK